MSIRLDIGGGDRPQPGYTNVDLLEGADVRVDLDEAMLRLPYDDDTVEEVYSSHCLEHLEHPKYLLREVARVCRVGARVIIRVPHWLSPLSFVPGHRGAVTEEMVAHWRQFPEHWWGDSRKWLSRPEVTNVESADFGRAQAAFPHLTADGVKKFVPGACFEVVFKFHVERRP